MTGALDLVGAAVAMAVRVTLDGATGVTDTTAYGRQVGKRIQGTFGAELRRNADENPTTTAEDLFWSVIAPKEFPWLTVDNPAAEAIKASGARDRARHADPRNRAQDWDAEWQPDDEWTAGLAAAKASVGEPTLKPYKPEIIPDPEFQERIEELRMCVPQYANRNRG